MLRPIPDMGLLALSWMKPYGSPGPAGGMGLVSPLWEPPIRSLEPFLSHRLPTAAVLGSTVNSTLEGPLTIRDLSLEQSFVVTATLVSPDQIEGTAATVVSRDNYGLEIIVAPRVTNVEDEVELYIDFVARAE